MRYIRTFEPTQDEWNKYGISVGSPLLKFPRLETLELWDPDTRNRYKKYGIQPALVVEERLAGQLLIVHHRSDQYLNLPYFPFEAITVPLVTSSSSTISAITIGDRSAGSLLMASLVRCANVLPAKRYCYHDQIFANLKTFKCKLDEPFEPDDLAAILSSCPRLVELSVYIEHSTSSLNKIGPLLSSMSGTLKIVDLNGAGIEWLSFLNKSYRVSLDCLDAPSDSWMQNPANDAALSSSQEPALQRLTLRVERYLVERDISYAAKYLDAFIGNSAEVILLPEIAVDILEGIGKLRSAITQIKEKKTDRSRKSPGFRLVETTARPIVDSKR